MGKEFSQQTLHKDVAVITLETEVPDLPNVRPVCLAEFNGPDLAQQTATVVGWGSLRDGQRWRGRRPWGRRLQRSRPCTCRSHCRRQAQQRPRHTSWLMELNLSPQTRTPM